MTGSTFVFEQCSIGTDNDCYGDRSPVLAVAVIIGTVIPTVRAWLTKTSRGEPYRLQRLQ